MSMREQITGALGLAPCADPKQLSALTLAYLGDTIYDLYARTLLAMESDAKVHALHLMSNRLVCAKGQAEAFFRVQGMLDEEERICLWMRYDGFTQEEIAEEISARTKKAVDRDHVRKVVVPHLQVKARRCGFFPPSEIRGQKT